MPMTNRVMKVLCRLLFTGCLVTTISCGLDDQKPGLDIFSNTFDFSKDQHGFQVGFSDYSAKPEDTVRYALKYAYTLDPRGDKAILISGNNYSQDLFMFLKKKLTGLQPGTSYTITFNVEFASNARIGSSIMGESVYMKVGATAIEPKSTVNNDKYVMNIDKGDQSQSGADMIAIGNVAAPSDSDEYAKIQRTNASSIDQPLQVRTNEDGELWLIVGTDSAFDGVTTLFYTSISVVLSTSN